MPPAARPNAAGHSVAAPRAAAAVSLRSCMRSGTAVRRAAAAMACSPAASRSVEAGAVAVRQDVVAGAVAVAVAAIVTATIVAVAAAVAVVATAAAAAAVTIAVVAAAIAIAFGTAAWLGGCILRRQNEPESSGAW